MDLGGGGGVEGVRGGGVRVGEVKGWIHCSKRFSSIYS